MSSPIEDYALLGDTHGAALVSRDGAVDWLCLPRFDAPACFAALLGDEENGHWSIAPHEPCSVERRYRGDTLVLETDFDTADGSIRLVDFMPPRTERPTSSASSKVSAATSRCRWTAGRASTTATSGPGSAYSTARSSRPPAPTASA